MMSPIGHAGQSERGVWIPLDLEDAIKRLHLKPPSRWNVFVAILLTWCHYGRREAWLTVRQIAAQTDLSERTVKAARADLIALGIVRPIGSRGKLAVVPEAIKARTGNYDPWHDDDGLNDRLHHDLRIGVPSHESSRPYPVSPASASGKTTTFTPKQLAAIEGCFADASKLLGADARELAVPEPVAAKLGIEPPVTYGRAYQLLDRKGGRAAGRAFVGAVLKLRQDERVQGSELELPISERPAGIRENAVGSFTTNPTGSLERPIADGCELPSEPATQVICTESSSCK